jgi:hypothetical protein
VRELRHCEHEDQIEEQLDHADAAAAGPVSIAQECNHWRVSMFNIVEPLSILWRR